MIINLDDIPEEGQSWIVNQNTGELNQSLKDLLQGKEHSAEFTIRPMANNEGTFQLTGKIKTQTPEMCSRCGIDFSFDVSERFQELLLPKQKLPRDGKFAKANHFSDMANEGPSIVEYFGRQFNMGEYMHEIVALAVPYNPAPEVDPKGDCLGCKLPVSAKSFNYDDDLPAPESPFQELKKLKLN